MNECAWLGWINFGSEKREAMTDDIRARIEKLIPRLGVGSYPGIYDPIKHDMAQKEFDSWRQALIDRLAKDASSVHIKSGYSYGLVLGDKTSVTTESTALMLDIQPIAKGVTKAELLSLLNQLNGKCRLNQLDQLLSDVAARIEREGIRNE